MCDDICICISIGCPKKISQGGGDGQARVCPRCHNASVFQASSRTWIEICFIPLIPCKSSDIWHCSICQWQADLDSFQPQMPMGMGGPQMMGGGNYMQPGYGGPPPQPQGGYYPGR